jgi:hypothetical protein
VYFIRMTQGCVLALVQRVVKQLERDKRTASASAYSSSAKAAARSTTRKHRLPAWSCIVYPRVRCQGGIPVGFHFVLSSSNFGVKICTRKIKLYYKWDLDGIPPASPCNWSQHNALWHGSYASPHFACIGMYRRCRNLEFVF